MLEHKSGNISETRKDRGKVTLGPWWAYKRFTSSSSESSSKSVGTNSTDFIFFDAGAAVGGEMDAMAIASSVAPESAGPVAAAADPAADSGVGATVGFGVGRLDLLVL